MIAVLDARCGLEDSFRARIVELVREVRREPSCITFTAYEARDVPGLFHLYEVCTDAAAFDTRLRTEYVHRFISAIPALGTSGPGTLAQLDELPIDRRQSIDPSPGVQPPRQESAKAPGSGSGNPAYRHEPNAPTSSRHQGKPPS
ncbi:putative quinol monooxygenase [Streptomyces mirabilis]|uniref:putative quinol monooxygenase n=1 Tax=Streptomyces mirabilis TaxID=68239 RepID=UPI00331A3F7F